MRQHNPNIAFEDDVRISAFLKFTDWRARLLTEVFYPQAVGNIKYAFVVHHRL